MVQTGSTPAQDSRYLDTVSPVIPLRSEKVDTAPGHGSVGVVDGSDSAFPKGQEPFRRVKPSVAIGVLTQKKVLAIGRIMLPVNRGTAVTVTIPVGIVEEVANSASKWSGSLPCR